VFRELRLSRERERVKPLLTGEFPEKGGSPEEKPLVPRLEPEESPPPFVCPYDGEVFETRSRYERHMASAHPPRAVSAADIEKALAGIDYPKRKSELVEYAARRVPPDSEVLRLLAMLPDRTYRSAADVAKGFGELKERGAGEHAAGMAPDS
jgi:hypothetical protein